MDWNQGLIGLYVFSLQLQRAFRLRKGVIESDRNRIERAKQAGRQRSMGIWGKGYVGEDEIWLSKAHGQV